MPFITKLDFSDNRQVKQNIETNTVLSGGTTFGTPFSMLPTGPDPQISAVTSTSNGLVSTFSGNSTTTVYSWYTPIMGLADAVLSAWTPSNSATTQNTGNLFSGATSTTTVEANASMNMVSWFMGTKQTTNENTTKESTSKKQMMTSGIAPNRLLIKTFLKKASQYASNIA